MVRYNVTANSEHRWAIFIAKVFIELLFVVCCQIHHLKAFTERHSKLCVVNAIL